MRLLCEVTLDRCEGRNALVEVLLEEDRENRLLVGEVLVERSDRDPGAVGDVVGGGPDVALLLENASSGLHDLSDGEARPALGGPFSRA